MRRASWWAGGFLAVALLELQSERYVRGLGFLTFALGLLLVSPVWRRALAAGEEYQRHEARVAYGLQLLGLGLVLWGYLP